MIEAVVSGALTFTTDGAAALGAVPAAALGDRGALPLARRRAHGEGRRLADLRRTEQGPRREARHAHARRHLLRQAPSHLRQQGGPQTVADMAGFKLRVPPVDTFRAMAEAWGARATPVNFNELYLALEPGRRRRAGESAADDPERQAQRGAEIPGADRPHHHAAAGHRERGVPEEALRRRPRHPDDGDRRTAPPGRTRSSPARKASSPTR